MYQTHSLLKSSLDTYEADVIFSVIGILYNKLKLRFIVVLLTKYCGFQRNELSLPGKPTSGDFCSSLG